jgi:FlaA1/EpsC-like NDP-sugar epimerase
MKSIMKYLVVAVELLLLFFVSSVVWWVYDTLTDTHVVCWRMGWMLDCTAALCTLVACVYAFNYYRKVKHLGKFSVYCLKVVGSMVCSAVFCFCSDWIFYWAVPLVMGLNVWIIAIIFLLLGRLMTDTAIWIRMPYIITESALYGKCFASRLMVAPYCLAASFLCVPMPLMVDVEYSWIRYIEAILLSLWILYYFYRPVALSLISAYVLGYSDNE